MAAEKNGINMYQEMSCNDRLLQRGMLGRFFEIGFHCAQAGNLLLMQGHVTWEIVARA